MSANATGPEFRCGLCNRDLNDTDNLLACRNTHVRELAARLAALEECAVVLSGIMAWREYEADPEGYKREHGPWQPLLPWRRALAALDALARLDAEKGGK